MNAHWIKYLPIFLREWLDGRQKLQRVIGNSGWIFADKILRMALGVLVGAWITRQLGPEQFGVLAYVGSFLAFFHVVANMQADEFIVRDISREPENASVILGTVLWLRVFIGFFCWAGAVIFMYLLHSNDERLCLVTLVLGATLVVQATDTIDLWFQSQSQSKRTIFAKFIVHLISNCIKVALLLSKAPLIAFAGIAVLEGSLSALGLAIAYRRFSTKSHWRIRTNQVKALLNQCWPFILNGLFVATFARIDQIMLKEMLGERSLGIYAAALPMSNAWTVLPTTFIISLAPYIAQIKSNDEKKYQDLVVKIFRYFSVAGLIAALMTTIASPWLIRLLYGAQYQESAKLLSIHVFSNIFIFLGVAQYMWAVNNNVKLATVLGTFISATVNIFLNYILINNFGIIGAPLAILLTECIAVVIIPCIFRRDLLSLYRRAFYCS